MDLNNQNQDIWTLYFIVRNSLHMSAGKVAAQCSHATGMIFDYIHALKCNLCNNKGYFEINDGEENTSKIINCLCSDQDRQNKINNFFSWKSGLSRKIILQASDAEFEQICNQFECFKVVDAGLTEVPPTTPTVLAFLPMKKNDSPEIIKNLKLF